MLQTTPTLYVSGRTPRPSSIPEPFLKKALMPWGVTSTMASVEVTATCVLLPLEDVINGLGFFCGESI